MLPIILLGSPITFDVVVVVVEEPPTTLEELPLPLPLVLIKELLLLTPKLNPSDKLFETAAASPLKFCWRKGEEEAGSEESPNN